MAKTKRAKRSDGRMQTSFVYNGKRYYVYGYSARELSDKVHEKRLELEQGTQDRSNPTLNAYYKQFTENRRSKIKEATIRCQSFQFRNCADIAVDKTGLTLGEMRIREIKPYDIQTVQKKLEGSGRKTETVNNCMAHLSHVFNAAVRDETIDRSPCKCLERVKRTEAPARETIHRALTEQETKLFMRTAADSAYYNVFCMMLQTGMRIGEVAALTMTDIDTIQNVIHVTKTVTRDEIGAYSIGSTPKTDAGTRDIPMTEQVADCIKRQKQLNRWLYGDKIEGVIFRSVEGALLREYQANREIKRICRDAGIEKFTCHAFRATFATRFIEQRPQDYKVLSEILGHSNTKITLDLYTHVMKDSKVRAMNGVRIAI